MSHHSITFAAKPDSLRPAVGKPGWKDFVDAEAWLAALRRELSRQGVPAEVIEHALAAADTAARPDRTTTTTNGSQVLSNASRIRDPDTGDPSRVRLEVRGVSKGYGRRNVLNNVDLTVHAGEVAAIIGANGAGKSTLLRICAGLTRPSRGNVFIDGTVGYCPQDDGVLGFLTADDHFTLFGVGRGLDRRTARRIGRSLTLALSWKSDGTTQARHLSGGTRQKLGVALSMMGDPDILLLDEPYQGFDKGTYFDFWDTIWKLRDTGKSIVVVTHMLNALDQADVVLDLTPTVEMVSR